MKTSHQCQHCGKEFIRKMNMLRHMKRCQVNETTTLEGLTNPEKLYKCGGCLEKFTSRNEKSRHEIEECKNQDESFGGVKGKQQHPWNIKKSMESLDTFFEFTLTPHTSKILAKEQYLKAAIMDFHEIIRKYVKKYKGVKVNVCIAAKFNKAANPNELMDDYAYLKCSHPFECYTSTNIQQDILIPIYLALMKRVDDFEGQESGWNLLDIAYMELSVNVFTPLRVGENNHEIPTWLLRKKR